MNRRSEENKDIYNRIGMRDDLALSVFDSLPVGALLFERTEGILLANTKAGAYLNIDRERLIEEGLNRADASSGEKYLFKIVDSVVRSGHPFSQDNVALKIAGDLTGYFSIKVKPLGETRDTTLVIIDDVSERVKTERNLDEAETRVAEVVEYLPDPIFITEEDGTFTFFSYRDNFAFGYELRTFIGEKLQGLFADGIDAGELFLTELKEKGELEGYDTRITAKDDSQVNVSISASVIADLRAGGDAYIGTVRDITETVLRTEEITALKDFSENILDNIQVGVIVIDADFNVIRWSRGQEVESGVTESDVIGINILELLPSFKEKIAGRKTIEERGREVLRTGQPSRIEQFEYTDSRGQSKLSDLRLSPLRDNTGKIVGLVIINDNITKKVEIGRELEDKTARLEVERNHLFSVLKITSNLRNIDDIGTINDSVIELLKDFGWGSVYCGFYANGVSFWNSGSYGLTDDEIEVLEAVFNKRKYTEEILNWDRIRAASDSCYFIPRESPAVSDDDEPAIDNMLYESGFFERWSDDLLLSALNDSKGEIVGVFILGRPLEGLDYAWQTLNLLDLLANGISLVVEELGAKRVIDRRIRGFEAIARISRDIESGVPVDEQFDEMLSELKDVIGYEEGAIYFEDDGKYRYITAGEYVPEKPEGFPSAELTNTLDKVVRNNEAALILDAALDVDFRETGADSILCAPIVFDGSVYGCIYLGYYEKDYFADYDLELLTLLADRAAEALHNARTAVESETPTAAQNGASMEQLRADADELQTTNEELVHFDKIKDEFVSMLVHDLRTPLTGIIGSAEIVDEFISEKADDKIKKLLNIISSEARRMTALINDMRDFYSMLPGEIELDKTSVNLESSLQEIININREHIENAGATLTVAEISGAPDLVCDRSKLVLALSNILKTVLKHCRKGCDITLGTSQLSDNEISIGFLYPCPGKDCGYVKDVFESIGGDVPSIPDMSKSSDLGLYVAWVIIEAHKGKIGFNCVAEEISEMFVTIPITDI
ncbi:MAG: PAS domain S-box protein [bacterium]|nr:PAS domain S-box protein [bacterium]